MPNIALLSDTHGFFDPQILPYLEDRDQIWHAGDIGNMSVCTQIPKHLQAFIVTGNIDSQELCHIYPTEHLFLCGGLRIYLTHIGGHPKRYAKGIRVKLQQHQPDLFVCGHSHLLRIERDPRQHNMLHLNPGAVGLQGYHRVRTLLRFRIHQKHISNMEVLELSPRWPKHK
ncbi:MAG: metallophosphoesterase family protein [Myxococcota bacterium]